MLFAPKKFLLVLVKHCLDPNNPAELRQPVQLNSFLVYSNPSHSTGRLCRAQGFEGDCSINDAASCVAGLRRGLRLQQEKEALGHHLW